ncbi:MAG: dTDP-4-dehydrorhamnose reductase [Chitinophagales bacterium]
MQKIVVCGGNGQLGNSLQFIAAQYSNVFTFDFLDVEDLDITNAQAVQAYFAQNKPDICVNCAAYTQVDKAETEQDLATLINATAVAHLAKACAQTDSLFIHISTDYVFDGTRGTANATDAATNPLNHYGASKLAGEKAAFAYHTRSVVLRTAWVYGNFGHNFMKSMLRLGKEREELRIVCDQISAPTYSIDLAQMIMHLAIASAKIQTNQIVHFTNNGTASWYDFAYEIIRLAGLSCKVSPIPSTAFPTPAQRPMFSKLSLFELEQDFAVSPRHWKEALVECLEKELL